MTIYYFDLFQARAAIESFKTLGFPPALFVRRVRPILTAVSEQMTILNEQYERLIIKHGTETQPGRYEVRGDALVSFAAEFDPLLVEPAPLVIEPLTFDELEQAEGVLSESTINGVWFIIAGIERPYDVPGALEEPAG